MKRCPTCQRTYAEDLPDYCPSDGMRLVKETAAGFDPERTVLSSGLRVPEPVLPERPQPQSPPLPATPTPVSPPAPPQYYASADAAAQQPQPLPQPPSPPVTQPPPPPAPNFAQQGWSPQPPQPAQPWANPYQNPGPTTPIAPLQGPGRIEALAIGALVTGCCAVTIMVMLVARSLSLVFNMMLVLALLGLGLGVTGLILALQKPSRFGGIPLAIAGLATGTAALVYYFTL